MKLPKLLFAIGLAAGLTAAFVRLPAPVLSLSTTSTQASQNIQKNTKYVHLEDVSLDWRMLPSHQQTSTHLSDLTETLGSGLCAIDANQDGWMDIFFVGGSGHTRDYGREVWWLNPSGNRLLLNQQGKYFTDATLSAGLNSRQKGMGCAVGDLNNDGFSDLLVSGVGKNYLYRNNGDGSFSDISEASGILSDHWSTGIALADINRDGLIDIYISNYVLYRKGARAFEGNSGFKATKNISFDATLYDPEPNRMYLNQGNFQFTEQAQALKIADPQGRSLGARWLDINHDDWLDLLVINDRGSSNKLFLNHRGEHFSPAGKNYAPFEIDGAHDIQTAPFQNDADNAYFMTRGNSRRAVLLRKSDKATTFKDIASSSGLTLATSLPLNAWSANAVDLNNDGNVDLFIANGSTLPDIDAKVVPQAQYNELFINQGNTQFTLQQDNRQGIAPSSSRGSISVDLDNDGVLELLISNNNNPLQILKNTAPSGNWVGLDFTGNLDSSNTGAGITAHIGQKRIHRTLSQNSGFLSQSDPRLVLGIDEANSLDRLIVTWPDGSQQDFGRLEAGHYYSINKSAIMALQQDIPAVSKSADFSSYTVDALNDLGKILLAQPDKNLDLINQLWRQSNSANRIRILQDIYHRQDKRLLFLMMQALTSNDPNILLPAIEVSRKAELESSVIRLMPLLQHPSKDVQCATANTFRAFYDEEEAVNHRKMQAIPRLINLLENAEDDTAICATNALAAAERQRAVLPLLEQLKKRTNSQTKTAMIRALGLIRDTRAISYLQQYVTDKTSPPSVIASSLIALSRLNDPKLTELFNQLTSDRMTPLTRRYDIFIQLSNNIDSIVLPKKLIKPALDTLLDQDNDTDKQSTQKKLETVATVKFREHEALIYPYLHHKDKAIRHSALIALAIAGSAKANRIFEQELLQLNAAERNKILLHRALAKQSYSKKFIRLFAKSLIEQLTVDAASFHYILSPINLFPADSAALLLETISAELTQEGRLLSVLNTCTDRSLVIKKIQNKLLQHPSPMVRATYVDCLLNQKMDKDQIKAFKIRFILRDVFSDTAIDDETKTHLMIKLSRKDSIIAKTFLLEKLSTLPMRWQQSAISALENIELDSNTEHFLWDTLRNSQYPDIRMKAALILSKTDPEPVLSFLRKELLH